MVTNNYGRFLKIFIQYVIDEKEDPDIGIPLLCLLEQVSQCGTIGEKVGLVEIIVLIIAQFCPCPVVVGGSKDENHIRASQARQSGDKRPVAVIFIVVAVVADRCTAVGVVLLNEAASLIDDLPPPGLSDIFHIGS